MSDFNSVARFCNGLQHQPIDIIILNAAMATHEYEQTKDGWETTSVYHTMNRTFTDFGTYTQPPSEPSFHCVVSTASHAKSGARRQGKLNDVEVGHRFEFKPLLVDYKR